MKTIEQVKAILARLAGTDAVGDDQHIGHVPGGLGLDSLDRLEATIAIEEAFDIEIPDDHVDDPALATAAGIAAYVDRRLGAEGDSDGFETIYATGMVG